MTRPSTRSGKHLLDTKRMTVENVKTVCMYCKKHIRGPKDAEFISHGICDECMEEKHPDIDTRSRNMKAWDYDAVIYDSDVYCVDCLPEGVDVEDEEVTPIFASDEWDHAPVCCVCGEEHDYMGIIEADEPDEPDEEDDDTEDNPLDPDGKWRCTGCRRPFSEIPGSLGIPCFSTRYGSFCSGKCHDEYVERHPEVKRRLEESGYYTHRTKKPRKRRNECHNNPLRIKTIKHIQKSNVSLLYPDKLRDVEVGEGYRLRLFDTHKTDSMGKTILAYDFNDPTGMSVFNGADFACSPMHAIDSDETLRSLLSFITLRPGDTDSEYFENYTKRQMEFAEGEAEQLQMWLMDLEDGGMKFKNWRSGRRRARYR